MSLLGTSVMGMNCHKCGALLPAEAAYCPSCGAPRSEIDHFVRETERAVLLALTTGVRPRGQGPPARVRQGGPDPAAGGRGRRQSDERRGRRHDAHGRSHGASRQGGRRQDRRGGETGGLEGHRTNGKRSPQDPREGPNRPATLTIPGVPSKPFSTHAGLVDTWVGPLRLDSVESSPFC